MTAGWVIGVLVELPDEDAPLRHFYAVAQPDLARAEWSAVDLAMTAGPVAPSPHKGVEPVAAVGALSDKAVKALGLGSGQARALGSRWPRRWVGADRPQSD